MDGSQCLLVEMGCFSYLFKVISSSWAVNVYTSYLHLAIFLVSWAGSTMAKLVWSHPLFLLNSFAVLAKTWLTVVPSALPGLTVTAGHSLSKLPADCGSSIESLVCTLPSHLGPLGWGMQDKSLRLDLRRVKWRSRSDCCVLRRPVIFFSYNFKSYFHI